MREEYFPVVTQFIADLETNTVREDGDDGPLLDLTNTKMNPYTLGIMLQSMGYKKKDFQSNGWEFDFWIKYSKEGCKPLLVWGTGITFNLWLQEDSEY